MFVPSEEKQDKCRILALSGGGSKGAYEVGVLQTFVNFLSPELVKYDVISGVSVGAINSCAFGVWEPGREKEMANYAEFMWRKMQNEKLWKM